MSECSHNCGTCGENCSSRTQDKKSFLEALAPESSVKKVIGVVSGKGGVGKSLVTSMMAVSMSRKGKHAAILDADITGPSIPMAFGVAHEKAGVSEDGKLMIPARSLEGVDTVSYTHLVLNLLGSAEAILIPSRLIDYGLTNKEALSIYGVLTSMALPFILFPSALTNSMAVLLLPSAAKAQAEKDESRISTMVTLSFRYSCYMGILCIGLFTRFGKSLGTIIFHNELSGSFIMVLCWLCPFMYLATTMGSIQNGLGKTGITFLQNMFAMGIRLVFVLFAVPLFGIRGYLWGFLVSELLLAFLCCFSVRRQVEFHCNMADCVLKPGLVLLISLGLELALCTAIPVTGSFLEIVFHMGIITVCYGAFLGVILR